MSSSTVSRYRESGALTSPSKLYDEDNSSFPEDDALDAIAKEAELRLQHQREQNREARQIRYKELEKNARDENDDEDSPTIPLPPSTKNSTNSLLLQKFLNGDADLRSIEPRDLRRLLCELESKYKSLIITNSSMFNEKQALHHQIDAYKDVLDEHFETFNQAKRQLKDKARDFDFQKQVLIDLERNNHRLKEVLINCETLIEESENQQTEEIFFATESIHEKLKRIFHEKHQHIEEMIKLKSDLDDEKTRSKLLEEQISHSHNDIPDFERPKQSMRELNELKNRLQQFEADHLSLQQENKRYEAQLARYKQQLDDADRVEAELTQERRRLQRELRTARDDYENERTRSDVLQRENARLRSIRTKNLLNTPDDELILLSNHLHDLPIEDSN